MDDAISWALEQSKYKGAVQTVLMAISRRARGCVAECSPMEIRRFLNIGKPTYAWAISELLKSGDLEISVIRLGRKVSRTTYHLQGFCHSSQNIGKSCTGRFGLFVDSGNLQSPLEPKTSEVSSDPIIKRPVENSASGKLQLVKHVQQRSFLFPDILTKEQAREVCEDCRGTDWRTIKYLNADGNEAEGAVPCSHAIVRLAGRWSLTQEFAQEQFLTEQIKKSLNAITGPGPHRAEVPTQLKLRMLA